MVEYSSMDEEVIIHDDDFMRGKWSTLSPAQAARDWATVIGLQFVMARYGGSGPRRSIGY